MTLPPLPERRYSTRETALKGLAKTLCSSYSFEIVDKKLVILAYRSCIFLTTNNSRITIAEGLKRSLKKGREAEQQLAAQTLSLVVLTLGADSEDLFSEFQPILFTMLKDYDNGTESSVLNEVYT